MPENLKSHLGSLSSLIPASLGSLVPLAVVAIGVWLLIKKAGARVAHVAVTLALGLVLAGTAPGAYISGLLSQLTNGHL